MSPREQLAFGLERLAAVAKREDWRAGEDAGLTPTQAEILRLLAVRRGGVRLAAAADHVGVSQPTASDAVAALARKGLIEKRPDPSDGRAVRLVATRPGQAAANRWPPGYERIVEAMDDADCAAMLDIVSRAILTQLRAGQIPPQRMCMTCRHFRRSARPEATPHHCAFLDAPISSFDLRVDCAEHEELEPT